MTSIQSTQTNPASPSVVRVPRILSGRSSEGEHHLDTVGAIGSIPISRTTMNRANNETTQ